MLMAGFSFKNPETFTAMAVGYDYTMNSGQDENGQGILDRKPTVRQF